MRNGRREGTGRAAYVGLRERAKVNLGGVLGAALAHEPRHALAVAAPLERGVAALRGGDHVGNVLHHRVARLVHEQQVEVRARRDERAERQHRRLGLADLARRDRERPRLQHVGREHLAQPRARGLKVGAKQVRQAHERDVAQNLPLERDEAAAPRLERRDVPPQHGEALEARGLGRGEQQLGQAVAVDVEAALRAHELRAPRGRRRAQLGRGGRAHRRGVRGGRGGRGQTQPPLSARTHLLCRAAERVEPRVGRAELNVQRAVVRHHARPGVERA